MESGVKFKIFSKILWLSGDKFGAKNGSWKIHLGKKTVYSEKQAGAELGQAQLKLELELSFTWFKICCIKLINKNTAGYFDCH